MNEDVHNFSFDTPYRILIESQEILYSSQYTALYIVCPRAFLTRNVIVILRYY